MKLKDKEYNGFNLIFDYVMSHKGGSFTFYDDDYDCQSDLTLDEENIKIVNNNVDHLNPGYEEYVRLSFLNEDGEEAFFIDYHHIPCEAYCDGNQFYDKYTPEENSSLIEIKLDLFNGPIQDTKIDSEELNTGIKEIDDDEHLTSLSIKFAKLVNAHGLKVFKDLKKKTYPIYQEIVSILNKHNDGSYFITDNIGYLYSSYEVDENGPFKLTPYDVLGLNHGLSTDELLRKGAELYTKGEYKKAYPYYLISALSGNDQAISNLGYCYMYGRDVEKNFDMAYACFLIAAEKENVDACYKLSTIYRYNKDYENEPLARKYLLLAFKNITNEMAITSYASLCLYAGKEKLSGDMLIKDINGAYLLLLLARDGYQMDLAEGFTPHQEQYNQTLELLNNPIFDEAKSIFAEGEQNYYIFKDEVMDVIKFSHIVKYYQGDKVASVQAYQTASKSKLVDVAIGDIFEVVAVNPTYVRVKYGNETLDLFKESVQKVK